MPTYIEPLTDNCGPPPHMELAAKMLDHVDGNTLIDIHVALAMVVAAITAHNGGDAPQRYEFYEYIAASAERLIECGVVMIRPERTN